MSMKKNSAVFMLKKFRGILLRCLSIFALVLALSLSFSTQIYAGACNSGFGDYDDGACQTARSNSNGINCPSGSYPYYSCNGTPGGSWSYCWGCHVTGGSDSCPSECRAGSCGSDFSGAADCGPIDATHPHFGCKSNQACCKPNSCDTGSTGGCGANQVPIGDPDYAPSYTRCQTGGCLDPSYATNESCEPSRTGQSRFECYHMTCCTYSAPTQPNLTSPANGSTVNPPRVSLLWNPVNFGNSCGGSKSYIIYFGTNPATLPELATVGEGTTSIPVDVVSDTTYYWKVFATNGRTGTYSPIWSFYAAGNTVRGNVYDDVNATCSTQKGSNLGGVGVLWGTDFRPVSPDGTFSITTTGVSPQTLSIAGVPGSYICTPGCGVCPSRGSVTSPSGPGGNAFYFTQKRVAWWQASGAGVYAGAPTGTTIRSIMPLPGTRLIIPGANDSAALVKVSPTEPHITPGTQISDTQWSAVSKYQGKIMDYAYFASKIGVLTSTKDYAFGVSHMPKPPAGDDFYYTKPSNGESYVGEDWVFANTDRVIIFVNGNLRIERNITVPPGGFLAFIVNGSVTVSPGVTKVQGLYVMDDMFKTETSGGTDIPLQIEGSVVTWSGVSLKRDLVDGNLNTPAEKFIYRPDLIMNMPEIMKSFTINWQEVAPGAFGG